MNTEKESFNRVMLLSGARILGMLFSICIPMYLGRHLPVETYGTYKLITLIYWFSQVALNLGFDDSVNYFLRWDRKNFALFSFNALLFNFAATGLMAILLTVFRVQIGYWLNDPQVSQYLPLLGVLIVVTISSQQIEGLLLNLNRFKERLYLDAGTEFLKSLAIMAAFMFFQSIALALGFLAAVMTARLIWTIYTICSYKSRDQVHFRDAGQFWWAQARYGLPLGISRIIQNLLNIENLIVSSLFNITIFTYYTVGSFENPLLNSIRASIYEFINIGVVEDVKNGDYNQAAETWRRMTRKLFLVFIPFTVYTAFFSHELIVFIFSEKYAASAPFFTLFNLYVIINALNPEPLFRATSKTGMALKIKMIGTVIGVAMIIGGAYCWGPMAVMWAKIVAVALINITGLIIGARYLKTSALKLFLWKEFGKLLAISLITTLILRRAFTNLMWHPFWILAASFSLYFVMVFLASCVTKVISEDETAYLQSLVRKAVTKVALLRKPAPLSD